jgi:hypothetical protein
MIPFWVHWTIHFETYFGVICGSWVGSNCGVWRARNAYFVNPLREKKNGEVTQNDDPLREKKNSKYASQRSLPASQRATLPVSKQAEGPASTPAS